MNAGSVAAGSPLYGGEDAVEAFHESVGDLFFPVRQNPVEMIENHFGSAEHGHEVVTRSLGCNHSHPAAPHLEAPLGLHGGSAAINILEDQSHLVSFSCPEVLVFNAR